MVGFVIGMMVGGFLGVCMMALLNAASKADEQMERMQGSYPKGAVGKAE